MAWEDKITAGQINYIENLMIDLCIWDKRDAWFDDLVKKRCLSDFTRKEASTVIGELLRMKRDKKDREANTVFDFR